LLSELWTHLARKQVNHVGCLLNNAPSEDVSKQSTTVLAEVKSDCGGEIQLNFSGAVHQPSYGSQYEHQDHQGIDEQRGAPQQSDDQKGTATVVSVRPCVLSLLKQCPCLSTKTTITTPEKQLVKGKQKGCGWLCCCNSNQDEQGGKEHIISQSSSSASQQAQPAVTASPPRDNT